MGEENMRAFKPQTIAERMHEGDKYDDYFKYLTDYIIEYFKELAEEAKT